MSSKPKAPPSRGGYVIEDEESGKYAKLARVTSILEVVFKEAFGAMSYYGGRLALEYMAERDEVDDDIEDLYTAWKSSPFDPNKSLRAASKRGTAAHKLFEDLCQRRAHITGFTEPGENPIIRYENDEPSIVATEYDKGAAMAYHDLFQHLTAEEMWSEYRVHWTEHPITECPDEVCTHGYAGTADVVIPPITLGDMKTNKGDARYSASIQMAMYSRAIEQMHPDIKIQRHFVVIPRPDGTYDLFDDPKQFVDSSVVDAVMTLYKTRKAWGPTS